MALQKWGWIYNFFVKKIRKIEISQKIEFADPKPPEIINIHDKWNLYVFIPLLYLYF